MSVASPAAPRLHRGAWLPGLALIVLLLLFVALVAYVAPGLPALSQPALIAAGVLIALVPALIWLAFFYLQDRLEPEPRIYVSKVFLLGVLVALALGLPLVRDVFQLNRWLYTNVWSHLLGSILVTGFVQEFLIYGLVRYSVYDSAEFDQRTDGIIYMTAAALGFATLLNFDYILSRGGVDLAVGTARVTVNALAHASIAGVLGFFLGEARFERKPFWYLPAGLGIAAVLNGLFFFAQDVVTLRGLTFNPYYGLGVAAAIALVLLGSVSTLIRQANRETLALASGEAASAGPGQGSGGAAAPQSEGGA